MVIPSLYLLYNRILENSIKNSYTHRNSTHTLYVRRFLNNLYRLVMGLVVYL